MESVAGIRSTVPGMERTDFSAAAYGGDICGWVTGAGPRVLMLHGGPGLSYTYLDVLVEELAGSFRVATFQQRGLPPSTEEGPFTIAQALADIEAVLDHLAWERAYVVGHSWGGHLVFHAAVALPHRLLGALAVDPLGAVGDGAMAAFGAEMLARMPEEHRARATELDEAEMRGEGTEAEALEALGMFWPSYFADPGAAPAMPPVRISLPVQAEMFPDITAKLPALERAMPDVGVPLGVVVGEQSPMPPQEAGLDSAALVPGAWGINVPGAGQFVWHEAPGSVLAAMERLSGAAG
jgi:pimeloyl-ACP methyl ester carboxylesterase